MKSKYFLIPLILFLFCSITKPQTISSTAAGGPWSDTKTWAGGSIPNENNDVVINGPVIIGNVIVNNLTVNSGGSIEDECCNGRTILVKGDFINYGTIKDAYGGVNVDVRGNVHNFGKLIQNGLSFSATHTQYLESSTVISCKSIWKMPDGVIKASGPLTFDSTVTVNIAGDTLDMGNYKLTKIRNIVGFHDFVYGGLIYSNGEIDISGANVMHSNLAGSFILTGSNTMECGGFSVFGDLKIAAGKILVDEGYNGRTITVKGSLINDGTIKDQFSGLNFLVEGDVINNSVMVNSGLQFSGKHPQKISGSGSFGTKSITKNPDGLLAAGNDLVFDTTASIDLSLDTLLMGKYKLIKHGSKADAVNANVIWSGLVISDGEIDVEGRFTSDLDGNFVLTGNTVMEFGNCKVRNNLVIAKGKTISDECCVGRKIEVMGSITNYGKITDRYGGLVIDAYGDVFNYSTMNNSKLTMISSSGKILQIKGKFDCPLYFKTPDEKTSGTIKINDFAVSSKYAEIVKPLVLEIPNGCTFYNNADFYFTGSLNVLGIYSRLAPVYYNDLLKTDETFLNLHGIDAGKCDTAIVTLTNNRPHPEMTSSVKRWWRVTPNKKINSYTLKLRYSDELLNGNDPNTLSAYTSTDQGKTWKRISNALNTTRDFDKKIISIGNDTYPITEEPGDIILSSGGIATTPSVSVTVIGRKQIRVGPPNRYTVSYWNSSDIPTDGFFITLNTEGGVHIKSVILSEIATGKPLEMPIDSLTYNKKDDEVMLYAAGLNPNQARSFDVVLTSEPGTALQKTNVLPAVVAVAVWLGGAIVTEYVKSALKQGCYEIWRPVGQDESAKDACIDVVVNSIKTAAANENPARIIAEEGAQKLIKTKITDKIEDIIWPVTLPMDILECLGNTIKGMKDYVNGGFDKNRKDLEKVTSWDPNAKEGPAGFGSKGYIATSAPMTYTIFFENKKEATAPAYKIVVWDTLDKNVFDVSTVEFGKMSHPNVAVTSRTDNTLKWEFTAIELPPNQKPPEGEGWVQFTVHPKKDLPTGTVIKNRSTIVFDLNPPLSTNIVQNTLDFEAPVTTVSAPKFIEGKNQVYLEWKGDDKTGAGIKTSTVFMANGDGPYAQACVSDSGKALVSVIPGQTYKFYVLSQDNVGNLEKTPKEIKQIQTGIDEVNTIPEKFELYQNYPNPFNPSTTIKFTLSEPGHSTLKIYNVLGEIVRILLDEDLNTGYHRVEFNAGNLASGVYFYHLTQKDHSEVKKMMLIK